MPVRSPTELAMLVLESMRSRGEFTVQQVAADVQMTEKTTRHTISTAIRIGLVHLRDNTRRPYLYKWGAGVAPPALVVAKKPVVKKRVKRGLPPSPELPPTENPLAGTIWSGLGGRR